MSVAGKGFWHSCVVHPLITVWPRVGALLHTMDEYHPMEACCRLQWAAITIDDEPVQRALRALAETEPFGPYLPHKRTKRGVLHNFVAHPLMWCAPRLGYAIHERVTTPNPIQELVDAVASRVDQRENEQFDALVAAARDELKACPRD